MTHPYLMRYLAGEYESVWEELTALGMRVYEEPYLSDATAVVDEAMRRVHHNLLQIMRRLRVLDYRFVAAQPWTAPDPQLQERVSLVEQQCGSLPLLLHGWFRAIGEVNLTGYHPTLSTYASLGVTESIYYADPLVVQLPMPTLIERRHGMFLFSFAPCFFHKSNYSGSGAIRFCLPEAGADLLLEDDAGRWTGYTFMDHLRLSLRWGGFAGFGMDEPGFQDATAARTVATQELALLTEDLLPF